MLKLQRSLAFHQDESTSLIMFSVLSDPIDLPNGYGNKLVKKIRNTAIER